MAPSGRSWSVVVPTRGRPGQLERCLAALERCAWEIPCEVLVVDDDPACSAKGVCRRPGIDRYLTSGGRGPAAARNAGARAASGELVAFTDDDCEPDAGWLAALDARLRANPGAAAAGHTLNVASRLPAEASQIVVRALERSGSSASGRSFAASNNVAFPREPLLELGGFDESFPLPAGEDRDLCDRWAAVEWLLLDAPDAVVRHRHELTVGRFWRQHFRYGRGAYSLQGRRRARGASLRPQEGFIKALAAEARAEPARGRRVACAGLLVLSQIANVAGYGAEAAAVALRPGLRAPAP